MLTLHSHRSFSCPSWEIFLNLSIRRRNEKGSKWAGMKSVPNYIVIIHEDGRRVHAYVRSERTRREYRGTSKVSGHYLEILCIWTVLSIYLPLQKAKIIYYVPSLHVDSHSHLAVLKRQVKHFTVFLYRMCATTILLDFLQPLFLTFYFFVLMPKYTRM